ncbi:hypothetical protein M758_12G092900 [Ceratodon purpureus]|uniref:RING-type E3 ubiquitin transferase n=1 Tax=Ceratodon purpureus TaxID=3225 RepID=A0A8T0G6D7_CERPU|nr:hypothetical protein KC19_12G089800 [Ceratodon purpureus]KAG0598676.1 hypothetical protein M758_12G092900 [Ceratodon purpureus]
MGGLCCCLSSDTSFEDFRPYQTGSFMRDCFCLRSCLPWLFNSQYSTNFDEVEHEEPGFSNQVSTSTGGGSAVGSSLDTSIPEVFQAPPTPLPYDADTRYLRNARDGRRSDKSGMSQESLRHSNSEGEGTALQRRSGNDDHEEQTQGLKSDAVDKNAPSSKTFPRVESALSMLDDDDVCPTCLDEYTEENPRITTACGHNYHLSCIYEWMERSNRCPVCDKEMIFNETA